MKTLLPTLAVTTMFASSALAGNNEFPVENARSYDGASFSVNIPDVECAVSSYLGIPLDQVQNDDNGLIQGKTEETHVMVATTNPQPESNWEEISWVKVINGEQSASIHHDGLDGKFIQAVSAEESGLPRAEYSVEDFETFLKSHQCNGSAAALS